MKTNILICIINIIKSYKVGDVMQDDNGEYGISINNMGAGFEKFIKNAFCNSFYLEEKEKIIIQSEYFSYLGNQNNIPDLIIRNGDAFEVKKIESNEGSIALNSSFPKNKLYSCITNKACQNCEANWQEKDICYIVGCLDKKTKVIRGIWFAYGDCYCANPEIYTQIKDTMTNNIQNIGIELGETSEIARVNKVDPLGITYLRVRGMWGIEHPSKVFEYITTKNEKPYIKALMLKSKFQSFDENSRNAILQKCNVKDVKIQNPNNPANLLEAVLIEYEFEI